jgi:signal peptidase II
MNSRLSLFLLVLLAALTAACDLGTKQWAAQRLAHPPSSNESPRCERDPRTGGFTHHRRPANDVVLVAGALELHYAENCVAAFGVLTDASKGMRRFVLFAGAAIAAAWLVIMARQRDLSKLHAAALGCIAGGAIGNLVDRVARGYVVDFIHAHYRSFDWPVFNVADIAIAVGIGLFVIGQMHMRTPNPPEAKSAAA